MPSELEILRSQVELLRECNEMADQALRSAWSIAEREGRDTYWAGHRAQLRAAMDAHYAARQCLNAIPPTKII